MKKLFKALIIVILMGTVTSTTGRFTGINLDGLYRSGVLMYILYLTSSKFNTKEAKAKQLRRV